MSDPNLGGNPIASAPVSFGVDEVIADDAWMPEPDDMLDWMAQLGYTGTELGPPGFLGDADAIRQRLSSRDLALVGAFLPQHFSRDERVEEDQAWLRENAQRLREAAPSGSRPFAVLCEAIDEPLRVEFSGRIASHPEAQLSADRWTSLVDNLHAAAELCRDHDVEPVFHPHAGTFIETADEIDQLMERLDSDLVGLCLDTGHFRYGGADPARCVRDYASLLRHVHLKDCSPAVLEDVVARGGAFEEAVHRGVFAPLGAGEADIGAVLGALRDVGYRGWLVVEQDQFLSEQDTPETLVAGQRANREYLRRFGL